MDTVVKSAAQVEGFITDSFGREVPRSAMRAAMLREHDLVEDLISEGIALQEMLAEYKTKCFEQIAGFRNDLAARYDARSGGTSNGVTLRSLSGKLQIVTSKANFLTFGPELDVAKTLIDECLTDWTSDGSDNLRAVVNDAFRVGEDKKVRMDRVLGLRRINIVGDDRWDRAMKAINDAVRTERSKLYVRLYRRETIDEAFRQIVLDMAAL